MNIDVRRHKFFLQDVVFADDKPVARVSKNMAGTYTVNSMGGRRIGTTDNLVQAIALVRNNITGLRT